MDELPSCVGACQLNDMEVIVAATLTKVRGYPGTAAARIAVESLGSESPTLLLTMILNS